MNAATISTATLVTLLWCTALTAQAPAEPREQTITVSGSGTVKFKPEGARVAFAVRASDNVFATAWKDNQIQADKLRAAFEGLKLSGLQIKIGTPEILHNDPNLNLGGAPGLQGGLNDKAYIVTRTILVVIQESDFAKLQEHTLKAMETALSHGANAQPNVPMNNNGIFNNINATMPQGGSLTRVDYFHSKDSEFRKQAFEKAVQAATSGAQGVAKGANLTLGKIHSISDQQEFNYNFGLPTPEAAQQELNGEIELTVRVRMVFKF